MVELRQNRVLHRDIRPANILFNNETLMECKLIDFGNAVQLASFDERRYTVCGAPNYQSPEMINLKFGASFESEIWSIGITIYTLLAGRPPFHNTDRKQINKNIEHGQY